VIPSVFPLDGAIAALSPSERLDLFVPSGRDGRGLKNPKRRLAMNDNTNTANTNQAQGASHKAPSHLVYHVRDFDGREGKKSFWTRIGSAWQHADGKGFNAQVECVPLDGRITLRVASEKKE
jgi:hypothetical protein